MSIQLSVFIVSGWITCCCSSGLRDATALVGLAESPCDGRGTALRSGPSPARLSDERGVVGQVSNLSVIGHGQRNRPAFPGPWKNAGPRRAVDQVDRHLGDEQVGKPILRTAVGQASGLSRERTGVRWDADPRRAVDQVVEHLGDEQVGKPILRTAVG